MKIGIIGCGLIGKKRAYALESDDEIIACCDTDVKLGKSFASKFNCEFFNNYKELITKTNCDIIIISVINKYAKEISEFALKSNKHVLVEKPMGINYKESLDLHNTSKTQKRILKVGFNHRFHPAIWKSKILYDQGLIGNIMFIRGHYGHGSRPGMENEWRSSKDLCGGGELLDQGVHLIDLTLWFVKDIKNVFGKTKTKFWNIEVEDNAFMLLESENNVDIQLQVSWTNWKNSFNYEIFGTNGYLKIDGLGGSYGVEKLEFGKRKNEGGIPEIEIFEYPINDKSWKLEWKEFKLSIMENKEPIGNSLDSLKVNKIIDAIYESSIKNKVIEI